MIPSLWFEEARQRIGEHIHKTPLTLDSATGSFIKWENRQVTGSFKIRGALNKVFALQGWERERGIVTASAGNHGQGVALAGRMAGAAVIVFASENAVQAKLDAMRSLGAELRLAPGGYGEAERAGLDYATKSGATWVSPYNDGLIIAGQGTLGLEIADELDDLERMTWIVPAGGGGLICGIGAAIKSKYPRARVIGVQSNASPFFYTLFHGGTQEGVVELASLADGLAGPVEANSLTIPMAKSVVDDFILVSEDEVENAIAYAWHTHGECIEGSGAVPLGAVLAGRIPQRPAVVVISGGNIQPEMHAKIIAKHSPTA